MKIVTRAEWGARYARGFRPAPLPAKELYLHHSVTTALNGPIAIRRLEDIGQQRFGGGISYTFAITPDGTVYEGHGIERQGAHTGGRNSVARAICLVGNYDIADPPSAMVGSIVDLVIYGASRGWWPLDLTGGHRDAPGASTACPGRMAYSRIPEINRRIREDDDEVALTDADKAWIRQNVASATNLTFVRDQVLNALGYPRNFSPNENAQFLATQQVARRGDVGVIRDMLASDADETP